MFIRLNLKNKNKKPKNKKYQIEKENEELSKYNKDQLKISELRLFEKLRSSWRDNSKNIQKEYIKEKKEIKKKQ